jgi:hypothetical protein
MKVNPQDIQGCVQRFEEQYGKADAESLCRAAMEKPMSWMVAALVEGSLGYHSPAGARRTVESYRAGERRNYSERCLAMYGGDLEPMIIHDVALFKEIEKHDPERARRIIQFAERVQKLPEEEQIGVGLLYPTMRP